MSKKTVEVLTCSLFSALLLITWSCPAEGANRAIVASTTVDQLHVQDFAIDNNRWELLRTLSIPSLGPVGTTALTAPNKRNQFTLFYTYADQNGQASGQRVRIDFEDLQVINTAPIKAEFGNFSVAGYITIKQSQNPYRFVFTNEDVFTKKVRSDTGKPLKRNNRLFDNDSDFRNIATGISWDGSVASQLLFEVPNQRFLVDFQTLRPNGTGLGNTKRFAFTGNVVNIGLSNKYTFGNNSYFFAATREVKRQNSTNKTAVFLTKLDAETNQPVSNPFTISRFKVANDLDAIGLNSLSVYNKWVLFGERDKRCNKYVMRVRGFNTETGQPEKKVQTLNGCNSAILQESPFNYGYSSVGFSLNNY